MACGRLGCHGCCRHQPLIGYSRCELCRGNKLESNHFFGKKHQAAWKERHEKFKEWLKSPEAEESFKKSKEKIERIKELKNVETTLREEW